MKTIVLTLAFGLALPVLAAELETAQWHADLDILQGRGVVATDQALVSSTPTRCETRCSWRQTPLSDGYLVVRHPRLESTLDFAVAVGTDVQNEAC